MGQTVDLFLLKNWISLTLEYYIHLLLSILWQFILLMFLGFQIFSWTLTFSGLAQFLIQSHRNPSFTHRKHHITVPLHAAILSISASLVVWVSCHISKTRLKCDWCLPSPSLTFLDLLEPWISVRLDLVSSICQLLSLHKLEEHTMFCKKSTYFSVSEQCDNKRRISSCLYIFSTRL